eukprot:scaffold769_cov178-Ochromonas_danica.AAC.2
MSVIWQLPDDILHSVYSEWLGWEDLSHLDIACVGQSTRKEWLTSLGGVRMSRRPGDISDDIFYVWLGNRRVFCLEWFPVRLGHGLQYLVEEEGLDFLETYCPAIHSIEISPGRMMNTHDHHHGTIKVSELKHHLTVFLSHCHVLRELTVVLNDYKKAFRSVLRVLLGETLRENILTKINMKGNRIVRRLL